MKLNATFLHEILYELDFAELNQRWTNSINSLFDEGKLENYYSLDKVRSIEGQKSEEQYNYATFLCWLLSSSYPVVRDRVTRIVTYMLNIDTSFAARLLEQFKDVKDLYVLERLLCAIYGSILLSEDNEYIKDVANSVISSVFKKEIVPPHIHLRHYARLIVERAYCLELVDGKEYAQSTPPYNSKIDVMPILTEEQISYIGTSKGTELMLYSIGVMGDGSHVQSDFFRYILGGNSKINSMFSKIRRDKKDDADSYYSIEELARMLCNEVKLMGWSDKIGELDNGKYSHNRHENKKERIGKKFQWLALYSVIAKLVDNNHINNTNDYRIPSDINFNDYFDPTIPIEEVTESDSDHMQLIITEKEPIIDNDNTWFDTFNDKPNTNSFVAKDNKGAIWVRISGIDVYKNGNVSK